jgi:long-subunit fatty acid transport protein
VTTPEEPFRAPGGIAAPPLFRGPDFFNPPPPRGFLTLTPSLAILGEYNDNLDLVSRGKIDDFITNIVPGFTLAMQGPSYQLNAGYNFGAEIFAQESDRNSWARSQQLFADAEFTLSPRTRLSLSEVFIYDRESNVVSTSGISAGFINSWRNTVAGRLGFQATQRTSLNISAAYSVLRYDDSSGGAQDSDTYRVGAGADYAFTPRLSGGLNFGVGFLDPELDESVTAFSPQVGLTYQITRTLVGRVAGGATASVFEKSDTTVTPSGSASLEQVFRYGSIGLGYDRAITAEAVGVTDRQTAFGTLRLTSLRRELQFELSPFYTHTRNPDGSTDRDLDTFTVSVRLAYQIARNLTLTGTYIWYKQTSPDSADIDQNRVLFGLQYAYPINFD